ncbi:hypothetical protein PILCRDRAFT_815371 [Piloderma croceum F 1598]|uniref:Uncharacterized protein n=1 Tax=Piloderma croceum (strain F 1598) TaxID=765440 RepID=A0A0C3BKI4_PILCF|nr:hypothetical protein PILCRDRAFT_815371 [Piloderma croceum F 1598]
MSSSADSTVSVENTSICRLFPYSYLRKIGLLNTCTRHDDNLPGTNEFVLKGSGH